MRADLYPPRTNLAAGSQRLTQPVGCENFVTLPGRTRERPRQDDHGAQRERHRMRTAWQSAALPQVA